MSDVIYLSNVRLSFPHIAEPQEQKSSETGQIRRVYGGDFLMPPDHPGVQQFMQTYARLGAAKWKENAQVAMNMIQADRKLRCYGSGEEKISKKKFVPYDGYPGNFYITAYTERAPQLVDADGKPIDPNNTMAYQALARKLYGGCYVNAAIKPWAQDNKHGIAIRCDLVAIQFSRDGDAFGEGSIDVTPLFGAVQGAAAPAVPAMPGLPSFMS